MLRADRDRSARQRFPWEQLRTAIASKLDEQQIALVHVNASGEEASPYNDVLAEMSEE